MAHTQQIHLRKSWSDDAPSVWADAWKHWTQQRETWRRRAVERNELAHTNAHDLGEMGISVGQARYESSKPEWRA